MNVKIGTRKSPLAMWQTEDVAGKLEKAGFTVEIMPIETKGDKVLDVSISKIGSKGVFTEELEMMLTEGEVDIAVHSAKDLQSELGEYFEILAIGEREGCHDVLVSRNQGLSMDHNITIGTSSTRRSGLLANHFPHINRIDMRGNLQTRLRKMDEGQCDALLLAFAGVHRMGFDSLIVQELDTDFFTPPTGQGAIAIECFAHLNAGLKQEIRQVINHDTTEQEIATERAFLKELKGGCSIPTFAKAIKVENGFSINCGIVSLDGKRLVRKRVKGLDPVKLGQEAAFSVLEEGGRDILNEIRKHINH